MKTPVWILVIVAALIAGALSSPAATTRSGVLAYAKFNNGKPTIWAAGLDGSGGRKLAANADTPVVAPDGGAIAYEAEPTTRTGQPSLRLIAPNGGLDHQLAANLRDLEPSAWSAGSNLIAAAVGPELGINRLVIINTHLGTTRTVAKGFIRGLSFAPDGSAALVFGLSPHSDFPGKPDLWVSPADGGAPKQITHDGRSAYPIWGKDTIAFQRYNAKQPRNDNPKANLFTVRPDGNGARQLTHGTAPKFLTGLTPLAFSADGTRLLAEFGGQDTSYAQTVNPATGAVRTVGSHADDFIGMDLSRDGSTILAAKGGYDPNGKHSVVTIPYAGGPAKVLVPGAYFATWTR